MSDRCGLSWITDLSDGAGHDVPIRRAPSRRLLGGSWLIGTVRDLLARSDPSRDQVAQPPRPGRANHPVYRRIP